MTTMDNKVVNTMRALSADMIEQANSGHPGICLGAAPAMYVLWKNHYKMYPKQPRWFNRDRFVMSAGHGSALYYSALHLFGFDISMDDIKQFRQFKSKTAGHPEYEKDNMIDCSTGPLGQGIAMAVGFAMSEKRLAAEFNMSEYPIIDHYTYALCGDGCLMEGISYEAASLAAKFELGKLIVLFDSNEITIDGSTHITTKIDMRKAYEAFGWQTVLVEDGNDLAAIDSAIKEAKADKKRPTLIEIKTTIGYGSPTKSGSPKSHGSPLGKDELRGLKEFLQLNPSTMFDVDDEVYSYMAEISETKKLEYKKHEIMLGEYKKHNENGYMKFSSWLENRAAERIANMDKNDFDELLANLSEGAPEKEATRESGSKMLNIAKDTIAPNLFGGAADLAASTKAFLKKSAYFSPENERGDNIAFGVRELAMTAICNGIAAYGGLRAFASTFFVFSDYMKPAMRLAALMKLPVLYVLTHDSLAVGEDGPTHQPVEQLAMLRSTPNLNVYRPCDYFETAYAFVRAISTLDTPSAILLSRQGLPLLTSASDTLYYGARLVGEDFASQAEGMIIASGSEVHLGVEAQRVLKSKGFKVNVLSIICNELFKQNLNNGVEACQNIWRSDLSNRLIIEAASKYANWEFVTDKSVWISVEDFGESAPADKILNDRGISVDNIVETYLKAYSI